MSRTPRARRAAPATVHTVRYGWSNLVPYTPSWVAWLVLPILAVLARRYWATSIPAAMAAAAGIVVVAGLLTAFTWHVFRARGHSIRVHATISVGAAGLWLITAVAASLHSKVIWSVWVLGGVGVCAAWTLRRVARGDGGDHHADGGHELTAAVSLAGARIGKPRIDGPKVTAPLRLVPGEQVTKDAQGARHNIASFLGVRPGAVQVVANPHDESTPQLVIVPRDQLADPVPWRGPTAPGQSIAERIEFGTYEDGDRVGLWLPGQHRPPRPGLHAKVAGMTGGGKTETALIIWTEILTRVDSSLIVVDTVKGIQSVAPIVEHIDLPVLDRARGVRLLKQLPGIIRARTAWLGQHGHKQWTPGCGLKYLVIWFEEAADLLADSRRIVAITEQARSAGISLVVSQQRWTYDRVNTSARSNFGGGLCFGVDNEDSAEAVLSGETIDAGATPWTWRNEKPGYMYLEAPGVPRDRWSMPARSDLAEPGHLAEVLRGTVRGGFDQATGDAIGDLLTEHWAMVAAGAAPWQKPAVTATRMPAPAAAADTDDEPYEFAVPASPDPTFEPDIDPEQEIPADDYPAIPLGVPVDEQRMGRTDAVAALRRAIGELAAADRKTVRPAELVELRLRIGRSPAWLTGELQALVAEGLLAPMPDGSLRKLADAIDAPYPRLMWLAGLDPENRLGGAETAPIEDRPKTHPLVAELAGMLSPRSPLSDEDRSDLERLVELVIAPRRKQMRTRRKHA